VTDFKSFGYRIYNNVKVKLDATPESSNAPIWSDVLFKRDFKWQNKNVGETRSSNQFFD